MPENKDTKVDVGVSQTQLEQEAAISAEIQAKRKDTDAHMKLQVNRVLAKGDIETLSAEEQGQLFNPDGTHSAATVQARVVNYTVEHKRIEMPEGRERPKVTGVGFDSRINMQRLPGAGESVNQSGQIVMVNPQFAQEQADRMRTVSDADAKNTMLRSKAMAAMTLTLSMRPHDVTGALYCNFEESRKYIEIYQQQSAEGVGDSYVDFLPLRQYIHKFKTLPDGRVVPRPILPNEVGVFQRGKSKNKILCLNDKDLANTDLLLQVPRAAPSRVVPSNPAAPVVGFTVSSHSPVQVAASPIVTSTSGAIPTQPQQPAIHPTQPVVHSQPSTRMTPLVPRQGHGVPPSPVPRGNPKLPPPPKGFKT